MTESSQNYCQTKSKMFVVIENFVKNETYGGLFLFGAALIALLWANSPWSAGYFNLWSTPIGLEIGSHIYDMPLSHWINDWLMAIFFLMMGLEIKREIMVGELSSINKAVFPIVAALGGMVVPAIFYIITNLQSGGDISGFGIPMATDIAFVLGFLLILGDRVPLSLKIFLTSLAIVDDLGAIIIIAIFYTSSLNLAALGYAGIVIVGLIILNRAGVKKLLPYLLLGLMLWVLIEASGIHATIAGVLLALTIPVHSRIKSQQFLEICNREMEDIRSEEAGRKNILLTAEQQDSLEDIEAAYSAVQNPLVRLENQLHPLSSFVIMPLFALANAGIRFTGISISLFEPISLGIVLGLLLGKPLGVIGVTFLSSKLGWIHKPSSLSWKHVIGGGILSGIGFTMSIFITHLAFENTAIINSSKLFIVACSILMGIIGVIFLWRVDKNECEPSL